MSGVSPQIEKDIAKKLVLTYGNKVLSEAKVVLANFYSYAPGSLEHWNKVMEVFVDAGLDDDPEFSACKEQLLTKRGSQPIDSFKGLKAADLDILKKELQAALDSLLLIEPGFQTLGGGSESNANTSVEGVRARWRLGVQLSDIYRRAATYVEAHRDVYLRITKEVRKCSSPNL